MNAQRITGSLAVALLLTAVSSPAIAGGSGADLFAEHKCATCHAIASEGIEAKAKIEKMKGPDLGGYKTDLEAAKLLDFLSQAIMLDEKKHKKKFAGSADDLTAILAWLEELEATPAK